MNQRYDVCIVGAGAAGLACANALDPALSVCMIDKNEIPGRKILATGGGRCNLTNEACDGYRETLGFFRSLGLETRRDEEGRYYPYSECAADVVRTLRKGLERRRIRWALGVRVEEVRADGGFVLTCAPCGRGRAKATAKAKAPATATAKAAVAGSEAGSFMIRCRYLLLCCGGKAAPAFGTTGDGYGIARSLGHRVSRVYPILTGIRCPLPGDVAGIRARGRVRLFEDGEPVAEELGEIQFTGEGISGICVFNLTPFIRAREGESPREAFARYRVELDLAPDLPEEAIRGRESSFGILTEALARHVPPEGIRSWVLPVENVWGWDKAQCTAGGVDMEQIDGRTMESEICPGLFFAGEILDIQGPCGGYNLQNAWATGIRAGRAISERAR